MQLYITAILGLKMRLNLKLWRELSLKTMQRVKGGSRRKKSNILKINKFKSRNWIRHSKLLIWS